MSVMFARWLLGAIESDELFNSKIWFKTIFLKKDETKINKLTFVIFYLPRDSWLIWQLPLHRPQLLSDTKQLHYVLRSQ